MKAGFIYFRLQVKKYAKILPVLLAESFLAVLFIAILGGIAIKVMGQESSFKQIKVGVVSEEEGSLTGLLLHFVEGMDSFKESSVLLKMEQQEAYGALESGEIYAAVFWEKGTLQSILDGTNIPVKVVLGHAGGNLETAVFRQVASAGGRLLSVAQAGIYGAHNFYQKSGQTQLIPEAEAYLNEAYLAYALNRASVFHLKKVSATGKVGLPAYYGISFLLILLLFVTIVGGRYTRVKRDAHTMVLAALGMKTGWQYLCDVLAFSMMLTGAGSVIALPVLAVCAGMEGMKSNTGLLWGMFIIVFFSATLLMRLLFQICGNDNGGIGIVFAVVFVTLLASGFLIPTAFLPVSLEEAGRLLPCKYWQELLFQALQGKVEIASLLILLLGDVIAVLWGMALFVFGNRMRGSERG